MNIKNFKRVTVAILVILFILLVPTHTVVEVTIPVKVIEIAHQIPAPKLKATLSYYKKTPDGLAVSKEEYELLARLVNSEAGEENMDAQIGVINVVLNRVKSSEFPNTIKEVIYQKYQFSVVANGFINKSAETKNYEAVDRALNGENTVSDCVYFWANCLDRKSELWEFNARYKYDKTVFAGRVK